MSNLINFVGVAICAVYFVCGVVTGAGWLIGKAKSAFLD